MSKAFSFPSHYNFPPFFTKQPNRETNSTRVQLWKDLILNYCRHHRIFVIDVRESLATSPLFCNEKISRKLRQDDANEIFHYMASGGYAEWYHQDGNKLLIYWKKPSEWATLMYNWARDTGHLNAVLTFYEIQEGDISIGTDLHGIDPLILEKSARVLEQQGKVIIFSTEGGETSGIKFLES
ncbi:vacuolar protein sorting 25 [Guillardia theta CCMP2712]|uniref:Vacuolar protein-sorting-associated protein 25 n=2 Tax=Guillardia theta TaxID=55529 RepID=L1ILK4_GUITC|nr:vacuolar protein sorting 25 [Guillardia theta CCMP2712]EKX37143.1 vacuolar protein sorting 25 [Guillardia theta CCMP2712]|eukprot:XP_005824123.1 vacuolar protein sorting 25 [Guillardia theta CCMP2712]